MPLGCICEGSADQREVPGQLASPAVVAQVEELQAAPQDLGPAEVVRHPVQGADAGVLPFPGSALARCRAKKPSWTMFQIRAWRSNAASASGSR